MSKKIVVLTLSLSCFLIISSISLYLNGCKENEPPENPENGNIENKQVPDDTKSSETPEQSNNPVEPISNVNQEPQGWIEDFDKAKEIAAKQDKDILMNFTGSDWCRWCKKLHAEVFGEEEFIEKASENFVLLELDNPHDKSLVTPETRKQNEQLVEEYGVEVYPTIYLATSDGKPYARTGYRQGGVEAYLDHLEKLRSSGRNISQLMSKAEQPEIDNIQKAKLIDQALKQVSPEFIKPFYSEYVDQIIALDSNNQAGLKEYHMVNKRMWDAEEDLKSGNVSAALEKIDAVIEEFDLQGEIAQEVYYFKAFVQNNNGDTDASLASLKKSYKAAPDSDFGKNVRQTIVEKFPEAELD